MRNTRLKRYKKYRYKKTSKSLLLGFVLPALAILITYLVISVFILPIYFN